MLRTTELMTVTQSTMPFLLFVVINAGHDPLIPWDSFTHMKAEFGLAARRDVSVGTPIMSKVPIKSLAEL